jgi:hypothetical protein
VTGHGAAPAAPPEATGPPVHPATSAEQPCTRCHRHPDAAVHRTKQSLVGAPSRYGSHGHITARYPLRESAELIAASLYAGAGAPGIGLGNLLPAARGVLQDLLAAGWSPTTADAPTGLLNALNAERCRAEGAAEDFQGALEKNVGLDAYRGTVISVIHRIRCALVPKEGLLHDGPDLSRTRVDALLARIPAEAARAYKAADKHHDAQRAAVAPHASAAPTRLLQILAEETGGQSDGPDPTVECDTG